MSVKKAIRIIDGLITAHLKNAQLFKDRVKDWDSPAKDLGLGIADDRIGMAEVLSLVKKELVPNCKHPKKMRDKSADGQWYCMNCNTDLDGIVV